MQLINGKKIFLLISLFTFCFSNSTCKKATSYSPVDMSGYWVSNDGYCGYYYVDIKSNNSGAYGTLAYFVGCGEKHWKGKARMTCNHLYIGITKFEFIHNPEYITTTDSIDWLFSRYKIMAKMTLKNSFFHGRNTYTFYKIKDY